MNLLRPQCVVVLVKRLKVLATCRELWVSGKPSNFLRPASGHTSHSFLGIRWITWLRDEVGDHLNCRATIRQLGTRWVLYSRGEWPYPWTGMRSQRLLGSDSMVLQACVLGLSLQGLKFDSKSSASHEDWDCLVPLLHRVRSWTMMISIWLDENNSLPCLYR